MIIVCFNCEVKKKNRKLLGIFPSDQFSQAESIFHQPLSGLELFDTAY